MWSGPEEGREALEQVAMEARESHCCEPAAGLCPVVGKGNKYSCCKTLAMKTKPYYAYNLRSRFLLVVSESGNKTR